MKRTGGVGLNLDTLTQKYRAVRASSVQVTWPAFALYGLVAVAQKHAVLSVLAVAQTTQDEMALQIM